MRIFRYTHLHYRFPQLLAVADHIERAELEQARVDALFQGAEEARRRFASSGRFAGRARYVSGLR